AMDAMSRSVDIRQALILKLPDDPTLHYAVGQSLVRFADYLPYWGHFEDALVLLLRAQEYYRFAYGKLPNNVHYGLDLSISFLLTAKAYWNVGRPEEAVGEARKAVEHLRRMARDNPSVPFVKGRLRGAWQELATFQGDTGHTVEAARTLRDLGQ